jgi:hypothetical protein
MKIFLEYSGKKLTQNIFLYFKKFQKKFERKKFPGKVFVNIFQQKFSGKNCWDRFQNFFQNKISQKILE